MRPEHRNEIKVAADLVIEFDDIIVLCRQGRKRLARILSLARFNLLE